MADPLWINASGGTPAYSAAELRQSMALPLMWDGADLGARPGVRPGGNQLRVTVASGTATVAAGAMCLAPQATSTQAPYWAALPVAEAHTLTAADTTNPRKDSIVARVYDHDEDGSGLRIFRTEYLVGTPAASPVVPATPAGSIRLAIIDVPKVGAGSPAVTDDRRFTVAAGGILPARFASDITPGQAGRYRHRLDTGRLQRDTGTYWAPVAPITYEGVASVDLTTTTGEADITGAVVNLVTDAPNAVFMAEATALVDTTTAGATSTLVTGRLRVDGALQAAELRAPGSALGQITVSQRWRGTLVADGAHTLQLRGLRSAASGTQVIRAAHTVLHVTVYES